MKKVIWQIAENDSIADLIRKEVGAYPLRDCKITDNLMTDISKLYPDTVFEMQCDYDDTKRILKTFEGGVKTSERQIVDLVPVSNNPNIGKFYWAVQEFESDDWHHGIEDTIEKAREAILKVWKNEKSLDCKITGVVMQIVEGYEEKIVKFA